MLHIGWHEKNSQWKITMVLIQTVCPNHIFFRMGKQGVCFVEVGALASVFEKSATELEPKPKLLRCKNIVNS